MELNWGILTCGKVSSDFVFCLRNLSEKISACAARSLESAKNFGAIHGIKNCYGSYEELVKDPSVNIIYIGSIHPGHYSQTLLSLQHGKHVLVEKPMGINKKETEEMYRVAKEKNLFIMEAMWQAFFPMFQKAHQLIQSGAIGTPYLFTSNFGVQFSSDIARIWKPELGGGGLLDIGIYPIYACHLLLGNGEDPVEVKASGVVEEGVDIFGSVNLRFSNNKMGIVHWHALVKTNMETVVYGTKGSVTLHYPGYCSEDLTLKTNDGKVQKFHEDLPKSLPEAKFNFLNTVGFEYEIKEVISLIKNGKKKSEILTPELSMRVAGVLDEIRSQIGLKYPFEK